MKILGRGLPPSPMNYLRDIKLYTYTIYKSPSTDSRITRMDFTTKRINAKKPDNANYNLPKINDHSSTTNGMSATLANFVDRTIDPSVLEKIRELDTSNASSITQTFTPISTLSKPLPINANPLRVRSGLYFRDILGESNNIRQLGGDVSRLPKQLKK
jgi:hypothetical protein